MTRLEPSWAYRRPVPRTLIALVGLAVAIAACGDATGGDADAAPAGVPTVAVSSEAAPPPGEAGGTPPAGLTPPLAALEPAADCRRGFDTNPAPCGDGVDAVAFGVAVRGGAIVVAMEAPLTDPAALGAAGQALKAEVTVENAVGGFGCGFGSVDPTGAPVGALGVYAFDYLGTTQLDTSSCRGWVVEGTTGLLWVVSFQPAGLSGLDPGPETRIAAALITHDGEFGNDSADDLFTALPGADPLGFIPLGDLLCGPEPAGECPF